MPSGPREPASSSCCCHRRFSLWATSVSEVLAEQPLENQLRLCYGNLVWTSLVFLLPRSHPPMYLSIYLSPQPCSPTDGW